jgi:hypothetical protein
VNTEQGLGEHYQFNSPAPVQYDWSCVRELGLREEQPGDPGEEGEGAGRDTEEAAGRAHQVK